MKEELKIQNGVNLSLLEIDIYEEDDPHTQAILFAIVHELEDSRRTILKLIEVLQLLAEHAVLK